MEDIDVWLIEGWLREIADLKDKIDECETLIHGRMKGRTDLMIVNDTVVILSPDAGEKAEEEVG